MKDVAPPEPLASWVQVLADVQAYRFSPGVASVLKNSSPGEQVEGRLVPDLTGLVEPAPETSKLPPVSVKPPEIVNTLEDHLMFPEQST